MDRWEFRGDIGGLKSILVDEDISLTGLCDKIYAKLGLSRDTMDLLLSYMPPLNKKCSLLVLKDDEDVAALLASRSNSSCKIPLGVILEPTEVCAYKKSGQESLDTNCSHDGFHYNYFNVDYCDSVPTDVNCSRPKLPVFQNVERESNNKSRRTHSLQ